MLNSLRFRLPALFLAGIALSGLVTSLIALRLFQDYTRTASLNELRREARGLAQLYAESAVRAVDEEKAAPAFAAAKLEAATGDRLFFLGTVAVAGRGQRPDAGHARATSASICRRRGSSPSSSGRRGRTDVPRGRAPDPAGRRRPSFGYLIVAKPKDELRDAWVTLLSRLAIAFLFALVVVGALAFYLTRRITGPVLALSDAADEVVEGQLRRRGAARPGRRRDRPPRRPLPRDDVAARRGRGARAQLPDVRLARAADAADGDPRPRRRAARGRRQRSRVDRRLARDRRRGGGAARPARRRRARPREARRAPVHGPDRGGRHGAGAGARLLDVLRGGPPARDRVHAARRSRRR